MGSTGSRTSEARDAHVEPEAPRLSAMADLVARHGRDADHVRRLQAGAEALCAALTPAEMTDVIVRHGCEGLGARAGAIATLEDPTQLTNVALSGLVHTSPSTWERWSFSGSIEKTPAGEALLTRAPVFVEVTSEWATRWPDAVSAPLGEAGARAAVPLLVDGRLIGALVFAFVGDRAFDEEDRAFVAALGRQCAVAFDRGRLFVEEAEARARITLLQRVTAALARASTITEIERVITDEAVPALRFDSGTLLLVDTDPDALSNDTPAAEALRKRAPVVWSAASDLSTRFPGVARDLVALELSAGAALPLYCADGARVLGCLLLQRSAARPLSEGERAFMMTIADVVAQATERARLFEDERRARLATELHVEHLSRTAEMQRLAQDALREAARRKDEFLAMLGHELRNPLMPIVTALELMRMRAPDVLVRERATIERQAQHLVRLVDDLLDVSRITQGKVDLKRRALEIGVVVRRAIETVSPLLEQRAHKLVLEVPEAGLVVDGDEDRLVQIVANLLTNAAKYTDLRGTITVRAQRIEDDVELTVRDTGVGISPELLPRVFELFVQSERSIDRSQGGLGLGLAIVRSLVILHGGDVEVESAGLGHGSTFRVRLPALERVEPLFHELGSLHEQTAERARPLSVLLVDDNQDACDVLAEALQEVGITVRTAFDGPTALVVAREMRPAVALLDIGLPVMDGYELAQRLREVMGTDGVKLVAITGYGQQTDKQRALEAGFDRHLVKPIDFNKLLKLLEQLEPSFAAS